MYLLVFETIHTFTSIALFKDNLLVDKIIHDKECSQAESIIILLENIIYRNNISYDDINYFGTLIGPGSFIRIRIGLSVALGLEFSLRKKVIGVKLFDVYKYQYYQKYNINPDLIILNAHQNNFYVRKIVLNKNYEDIVVKNEDLESLIKDKFCACSLQTYKLLFTNNNLRVMNIESSVDNLAVSTGLYIIDSIKRGVIDLKNLEELEPYYLVNPTFAKRYVNK